MISRARETASKRCDGWPAVTGKRRKVAYLTSRFPKISETFVLYEMLEMEDQDVQVALYPLLREHTTVMHPEAVEWVERAHFQPFLSWRILLAHCYFLRRMPVTYFGALWSLLRGTWGSYRYFTGALGIFPKTVCFARLMQSEGITHVHAHFSSHPAAAAFVIHRLTGIPYSFTAHGSDLHRDRHMLPEKVAEAAFVAAISNYNRKLILAECGEQFRDHVVVIHCGVDVDVFRPKAKGGRFSKHAKVPCILCIGTLHEVKGQTYLLEACRLLRRRGIDVSCRFAGDGPDLTALAEQATAAGIADRVVFHGRCKRGKITDLLEHADVVAAPSVPTSDGRREGIPVVLMEAMASGVPVVASDLSGIPELIENEDSGLLVPPGNAQALADALQRLVVDVPLRRRLAQAARARVVRDFNLSTNAATLAHRFSSRGHS